MTLKIPITFLGTGHAIPTARRNHSAILLQYKDENILVDCGEGTQRQFRKAKLNPCKLTRLLITHWHGDHILGIPGLLQTLALNNYNKTLHIYGPRGTKHYMEKIMDMFIYEGKIKIEIQEIEQGVFLQTRDFVIESAKMEHLANCLAYSFKEKDKTRLNRAKLKKLKLPNSPLLGELQKGKDIDFNGKKIKAKQVTYFEKGKKITFILDTKINENCYKIAKDSDLLITECCYLDSEKELASEYKHLTAEQAGEIAKKSNSKKLILTHISQRYELIPKAIISEAKKKFKNCEVAEDLMQVDL